MAWVFTGVAKHSYCWQCYSSMWSKIAVHSEIVHKWIDAYLTPLFYFVSLSNSCFALNPSENNKRRDLCLFPGDVFKGTGYSCPEFMFMFAGWAISSYPTFGEWISGCARWSRPKRPYGMSVGGGGVSGGTKRIWIAWMPELFGIQTVLLQKVMRLVCRMITYIHELQNFSKNM